MGGAAQGALSWRGDARTCTCRHDSRAKHRTRTGAACPGARAANKPSLSWSWRRRAPCSGSLHGIVDDRSLQSVPGSAAEALAGQRDALACACTHIMKTDGTPKTHSGGRGHKGVQRCEKRLGSSACSGGVGFISDRMVTVCAGKPRRSDTALRSSVFRPQSTSRKVMKSSVTPGRNVQAMRSPKALVRCAERGDQRAK